MNFGTSRTKRPVEKGTINMSSIKSTIIAISAALAMSAVTVGATVGPAQASTIQGLGI
ncbi:MAG TPA: hypothetical protein VHE36_10065 [Sphingomicrobium sp.]|jgi:hypothetical protein|nr:hypothetical protein [Sphingomicrobium sp.]